MAISVVMPALEMAQETGKLLSWLKKEGDPVKKGEPLVEIETDKIVVEIEATADGVLAGVVGVEGSVVPVGQTIAWIVAPGEQPPAESASADAVKTMTEQARPASTPAPEKTAGGPKISPKARRLAQERGVDISKVRGTGPDGTITGEDVLATAEASTPKTVEADPLSAIARLMAERTTQSWTQVPHFFLVRDVDAGELSKSRGETLTITDLLISHVAHTLTKHPKMNASWSGAGIQRNPDVNISVAMAVSDGVVTGVIPNAANSTLTEIATVRRDLTERARSGSLCPQDVTGGTFTISNLGMYGVDAFSAIITQPQAAILAVGRISDRVVAVDGQPAVRPMMTITLSCDHRVVDGAQAALFLKDLVAALEGNQ